MKTMMTFFCCLGLMTGVFAKHDSISSLAPLVQVDTLHLNVLSEGHNLAVTVLQRSTGKTKKPALIFLVGSGGMSSHTTNYKAFVKFFFADLIAEEDMALVYFDKRGVGASSGTWYEADFSDRALDAKNVALSLQKLDGIDPNRILVVGHSQGGWIAQMVVAQWPDIFYAGISMAGPTFGVRKQLANEYQSYFICEKKLPVEKAKVRGERRANRNLFFVSLFPKKGDWKQLKVIKNFEAEAYIKNIRQPFLLLFAEHDALVSPEWSLAELDMLFPQGLPEHLETYTAQQSTHSFHLADLCDTSKWSTLSYSSEAKEELYQWISKQLQASESLSFN